MCLLERLAGQLSVCIDGCLPVPGLAWRNAGGDFVKKIPAGAYLAAAGSALSYDFTASRAEFICRYNGYPAIIV